MVRSRNVLSTLFFQHRQGQHRHQHVYPTHQNKAEPLNRASASHCGSRLAVIPKRHAPTLTGTTGNDPGVPELQLSRATPRATANSPCRPGPANSPCQLITRLGRQATLIVQPASLTAPRLDGIATPVSHHEIHVSCWSPWCNRASAESQPVHISFHQTNRRVARCSQAESLHRRAFSPALGSCSLVLIRSTRLPTLSRQSLNSTT